MAFTSWVCREKLFHQAFSCQRLHLRLVLYSNKIVFSKEKLVDKDDVIAKKPIWYYNNKAIRKRKIDQLIKHSELTPVDTTLETPADTTSETTRLNKLIHVFVTYDFSVKEIRRMLYNKPRVLQVSKTKLQNRLRSFENLGIPRDVVKEMILKCPSLLLLDDKVVIQDRLNLLQSLPLFPRLNQNKSIYITQKTPKLLLFSERADLYAKVKNLLKLGFNQQQLYELVLKHPALLAYSIEAVTEKVNYVTEKMGGRLALFTKFPRIFSASLQRIKERHLFLLDEGYMKEMTYISENKLRALVLTTDNDFVYRVTKTKMKDFRDFQQLVRTNQELVDNIDEDIDEDVDEDILDNSDEDIDVTDRDSLDSFNDVDFVGAKEEDDKVKTSSSEADNDSLRHLGDSGKEFV